MFPIVTRHIKCANKKQIKQMKNKLFGQTAHTQKHHILVINLNIGSSNGNCFCGKNTSFQFACNPLRYLYNLKRQNFFAFKFSFLKDTSPK